MKTFLALFVSGALSTAASAAILSNPTVVSGTDAIDPAGAETIDQVAANDTAGLPGSIAPSTEAALEARSDFQVVQSFTGFGDTTNIIYFDDPSLPDLQFTRTSLTANPNKLGNETTSSALATSSGSAIRMFNNSSGSKTGRIKIDFGSYDETSGIFTSDAMAVAAASATLSNLSADLTSGYARFFAQDGTELSRQVLTPGTDGDTPGSGATDGLFALEVTGGQLIGYMDITVQYDGGSNDVGLDDIGFASVPEPASLALFGAGVALLASRRRRI